MKTKIALTKEQVDKLVEAETKALQVKFDRDVASLRKKYEVVEIEIDSTAPVRHTRTTKLTDELFNEYLSKGMSVKEIAELSNFNIGYIYKIRKRILAEK